MAKRDGNVQERIIQAAYDVIQEKGYASTTLENIVQRAGLTRGAFYYYFKDKKEILQELERRYESTYRSPYDQVEQRDTAYDSIKALVVNNILSKKKPNPYGVMFRYRVESGVQLEDLIDKQQELDGDFIGVIEGLIQQGIDAGEFEAGLDARKRAQGIYFALLGYETYLLTHGEVPYDRDDAVNWVDDLATSVLMPLEKASLASA